MKTDKITEDKIKSYLDKTKKALEKVRIAVPEKSFLRIIAEDFYKMAESYFKDAEYFYKTGHYVNAFACVNYAHAWLDAGVRIGIFDVDKDYELFTLFK